jgi:ProP effector
MSFALDEPDETEKLVEQLVAVYPRAFFRDPAQRRPLKIGIHRDLSSDASHGLSDADLRRAVGAYCRSAGYLAACTEGAERIDLNGAPAGTVTAEAVAAAVKAARLSQKTRRAARDAKTREKAVAAAPEQQTEKAAAPKEQDKNDFKNGNAIKLSLADLRAAAARRRQAAGVT